MQLGEFIQMLQEAGVPLTHEVIIGGRRDPRIVEPKPRDELPPDTIFIDGMQELWPNKRQHDEDVLIFHNPGVPQPQPAEPEEWNDDDDDFDDDEHDLDIGADVNLDGN